MDLQCAVDPGNCDIIRVRVLCYFMYAAREDSCVSNEMGTTQKKTFMYHLIKVDVVIKTNLKSHIMSFTDIHVKMLLYGRGLAGAKP